MTMAGPILMKQALDVASLWPPELSSKVGHIPLKGADQSLYPIRLAFDATKSVAKAKRLISPLVGEMAGRPEGGAKERGPVAQSVLPLCRVVP